jgi:hypothetical protein
VWNSPSPDPYRSTIMDDLYDYISSPVVIGIIVGVAIWWFFVR